MIEEYIIASDYGMVQIQHEKLIGRDISKPLGMARMALKGVRDISLDQESGVLTVDFDEFKTSKEELIAKAENLLAKYLT